MSRSMLCEAPSAGVFVTAPEYTPRVSARGRFPILWKLNAMVHPRTTISVASPRSFTPEDLKLAKKAGPT